MDVEHRTCSRLILRLPAACPSPTVAIERWLLALWQITPRTRFRLYWRTAPIALELLSTKQGVTYRAVLSSPEAVALTASVLPSYFPGLEVELSSDDVMPTARVMLSSRLELASGGWVDLAPEPALDLAAGLAEAMAVQDETAILLQWLLRPARLRWERQTQPGFWMAGRLAVGADSRAHCCTAGRRVAGALGQHAGQNHVRPSRLTGLGTLRAFERCRWPRGALPIAKPCSPAQAALLYHPPRHPGRVGAVAAFPSPRLSCQPTSRGLALGEGRTASGVAATVRLPLNDLMRHMLVVGPSGSGKTTFLAQLAREALKNEAGVTVFDPHGGLVSAIAAALPQGADSRAAIIHVADREHPIGINPFQAGDAFLAADDFVEVLRRTTSRSHWGPVQELALRHVAIAISETGGSLVEAIRLLEDGVYRDHLLATVTNATTARFLANSDRPASRLLPALTRLNRLAAAGWLRNILGQPETTIDFRSVLASRKTLLFDLSGLGLGGAPLIGSLLLLLIRQAALSRRPGAPPHLVILDEAALFLSPTVVDLLDQGRKFGVGIVLATQRLGQLEPESVRNAVLANVGSTVAFRIHDRDEAAQLAKRAALDGFSADALMRLPRFEAYAHLTVEADRRQPSWLRVPPPAEDREDAASLKASVTAAGHLFTRPRAEVEAEISRREQLLDRGEPEVLELDASSDPFTDSA
jgi:DNA polymerase III delta prime subunit